MSYRNFAKKIEIRLIALYRTFKKKLKFIHFYYIELYEKKFKFHIILLKKAAKKRLRRLSLE
jgi:hypothetical protein